MLGPKTIQKQIQKLTNNFIELSLSNHQNPPSVKELPRKIIEIGIDFKGDLGVVLKNLPYENIYDELLRQGAYNMQMLDGALIQMMYRFKDKRLESHRLAFFPSPYLKEYQNDPELYEEELIYAEIIKKSVVPVPLRFDFDSKNEVFKELEHPKSHLTLGQYANCRIPVTSPLAPYLFINFILRNFYHTAFREFCSKIQRFEETFDPTIQGAEECIIHIKIPEKGVL